MVLVMKDYRPQDFEAKWQADWERRQLNQAKDLAKQPKKYILIEFPYPSGEGLHVGHCLPYTAQDVVARYSRLKGFNVLYPIGWDAFGLPTENFAIKNKIHPRLATERNIANFKRQIKSLGISFDWSREINTTDPKYYKWTQWIFLQLFKAGLAEKKEAPINWCPSCKIGLAFEEVIDGKCERCGTPVEQRTIKQWILKITKYADRLIDDLDTVDYLPHIKQQQVNWIGRSEGVEIQFKIRNSKSEKILVATNNPSKVERIRMLLGYAAPEIQIVTPKEEGLDIIETPEGDDLTDNAKLKAKSYLGKTQLPILGTDMGFFIDGVIMNPARVKRNALEGEDEASLSKEQIGQKLLNYYKKLARKHGGAIDGYFLDVFALTMPDGTTQTSTSRRDLTLTDKERGDLDYHFPIRTLYIVASTGKYVVDQSKKEEAEIELAPYTQAVIELLSQSIKVFTTRPDTLFGATFCVLAPEHPMMQNLKSQISNLKEVNDYIAQAKSKTDRQRQEQKEKTGIELKGVKAINPINNAELPIFVADYVMTTYGTGAIMAVPAHDERDWEFAKKYKLPIVQVIKGGLAGQVFIGHGEMINSGKYEGLDSQTAWQKMADELVKKKVAVRKVNYKLRDWIFSRQHYWGEPIPIIICDKCGYQSVAEKDLPVTLPDVEYYEPTDTGESPLAKMTSWVNVKCPKCGSSAKRETDTMPNWAGSSWYFLRYTDPDNDKKLADPKKLKYWLPVDLYNGGMEHATLHLLYSRFWHKFLYDQGLVPTSEPYARRIAHGVILSYDGQKMSKSRGNVINPDDIVAKYGADTLRLYEMFMGEYEATKVWSEDSLQGVHRFLKNIYNYFGDRADGTRYKGQGAEELRVAVNQAIKRVTADLERRSFNTVVSQLMILFNVIKESKADEPKVLETFLVLLAPLAPHLAEELWHQLGHQDSVHQQSWPAADEKLLKLQQITLAVQINGKVRAQLTVVPGISETELKELTLKLPAVQRYLAGQPPKKFMYIKGKIISLVV